MQLENMGFVIMSKLRTRKMIANAQAYCNTPVSSQEMYDPIEITIRKRNRGKTLI